MFRKSYNSDDNHNKKVLTHKRQNKSAKLHFFTFKSFGCSVESSKQSYKSIGVEKCLVCWEKRPYVRKLFSPFSLCKNEKFVQVRTETYFCLLALLAPLRVGVPIVAFFVIIGFCSLYYQWSVLHLARWVAHFVLKRTLGIQVVESPKSNFPKVRDL